MIKKKLKTVNGWLEFSIPEKANEISLNMLIDLENPLLTDVEVISILSNIDIEELYSVRNIDDFKIFNPLINVLYREIAASYNQEPPKFITIEDKKIKVSKNLSVEPVGAYIAVSDIIQEELGKIKDSFNQSRKDNGLTEILNDEELSNALKESEILVAPKLESVALILAHYLFIHYYNEDYNEKKALIFVDKIKQLPCTDVLSIARYFFLKYPHLTSRNQSYCQTTLQAWKLKQELKRSKSSGG